MMHEVFDKNEKKMVGNEGYVEKEDNDWMFSKMRKVIF